MSAAEVGGYEPLRVGSDETPRGDPQSVSPDPEPGTLRPWSPKSPGRVLSRQATANITSHETQQAVAKLVGGLRHLNQRKVNVEDNSVYGAAILMPQLARTAAWGTDMTGVAISAYFYLFFTMALHAWLICYISKEETVMDGFSGQMFLCDFGANMETCVGDECIGPGGTKTTPVRLYDWDQWATRNFVRDSMKAVFPDHGDDIDQKVDPGEYGSESWYARILCCHIFILNIINELQLIWNMLKLIYFVPHVNEPWIRLDPEMQNSNKSGEWRDEVIVQVSGMSYFWKLWTLVSVFFPKFVLWCLTASAGIFFLMETASIDGVIVNSVALSFLLTMDELVMDNLMSEQTNWLLDKCKPYIIDRDDENLDDDALFEKHYAFQVAFKPCDLGFYLLWNKFSKFILAVIITVFFVYTYYDQHCEYKSGRWVSRTVHLPATMSYNPFNFFLPRLFPLSYESEKYWVYPGVRPGD